MKCLLQVLYSFLNLIMFNQILISLQAWLVCVIAQICTTYKISIY